ncbi:MAG: response regulator receiver protein [Caulobacteraceae bacterium]|nr:response regulator receiver protein [Caulobacteraceae bacterium]
MSETRTILTVDDSRTMRELLMASLSELGFRVVQGVDGLDGLEVLRRESADLIITDLNMPNLDGAGFIEQVRQDPRHRGTPILVLTTETDPLEKDRARRAGATGWILKPFDPVKLSEAIRRVSL